MLRVAIGQAFWSTDRVLHEDVKARLSASLAADRQEQEMDAGRTLRADEAIALAIHVAEACAAQQ